MCFCVWLRREAGFWLPGSLLCIFRGGALCEIDQSWPRVAGNSGKYLALLDLHFERDRLTPLARGRVLGEKFGKGQKLVGKPA